MNREDLHKRLLATFREEAAEHLQALSEELDAVIADPQASTARQRLETLFRVMHTLKGAARSVQLLQIEQICQDCEVELRAVTRGEKQPSPSFLNRLTDATDKLRALIEHSVGLGLANGHGERPQASASALEQMDTADRAVTTSGTSNCLAEDIDQGKPPASIEENGAGPALPELSPAQFGRADVPDLPIQFQPSGTVRVDVARLDRLLLAAEELLLPSLVASERIKAARQITKDLAALRAYMRSGSRGRGGEVNGHRASREALDSLRELELKSRQLASWLADDQRALRAAVGDLFQETREARMVPAASMLASFPAMVRDLCRETGKECKWSVKDTGLNLDRKIIELIKAPLIHLVRNAIDHGLETPEEREATDKPRRGSVSLSIVPAEQGRIAIEIADDGRGMNLGALREAAVRSRAATTAQAREMSDEDVMDMAFRPGVSTNAVITSISGLGLGLSIVREQMERIDGRVVVTSNAGKGTRIRLEVPSTVASYRALLVSVGGTRLLWPAEAVERVIGVTKPTLIAAAQSGIMVHGQTTIPFGRLGTVMGIAASEQTKSDRTLTPCIVANNAARRAIFAVDEVLGETEVLIKDFPQPLRRVRNISSVGLLATGELAFVLRPADLLTAVHMVRVDADEHQDASARAMRVLVVDDSITTRTMERNLLESAGYEVSVAADGLDAWTVLQEKDIDLVVSDIDMPHMNGFELTSRIRGDNRLSELPIVLVTALESRDDKERGIKSGANAYVLKSSFEESNLLEIVGRLI